MEQVDDAEPEPFAFALHQRPRERVALFGSRGDVVVLDDDPLAPAERSADVAAHLRRTAVAATVLGGRLTHRAL